MTDKASSPETAGRNTPWLAWGLVAVVAVLLLAVFREGLALMVKWWDTPEYNHGYLIPFVALYIFWARAKDLDGIDIRASWWGVAAVIFGAFTLVLGELSAVYTIVQYAFLFTVWGFVLAAIGWRGVMKIWPALLYLAFMIPLPRFLEYNLSAELQLISSQLGVAVIRAFGISVYVEGNVIDLGIYQLQVAEACSGLRYLFPLMSFGFLCAFLYQGRWWQRVIIFASTVPITVLMNSFRIGVIGILVNKWGIEQAEGFLHDFEGWVVFMACVGILFLEMAVFAWFDKRSFIQLFALDTPDVQPLKNLANRVRWAAPAITCGVLIALLAAVSLFVPKPENILPQRESLATFPLAIADWRGREMAVDPSQLEALKADDTFLARYIKEDEDYFVELWVAYYDTQTKGASVHSPRACLPGGGWQMEEFGQHRIDDVQANGGALEVNRSLISLGESRQLVYYWFEQRGRVITNEYLVKWFIFWDGLTRNRTDGALVRVVTAVPDAAMLAEAEKRLEEFVRSSNPQLAYYLPQEEAAPRRIASLLP